MFAIIGICVVLGAVLGGYLLEHGNLAVLMQPAEVVIIFGAALGSLLIASSPKVMKLIVKDVIKIFTGKSGGKDGYIQILLLLNQMFWKIKKEGLLGIEADVEKPAESEIFRMFPSILANHHAIDFLCDNFRVIISANIAAHDLDDLLTVDLESRHEEELIPVGSINMVSDSLPGLGIVAAVLGVVITMGKISEPPEVLGHSIGAALVGTFLGVLACYGFVGPMANNLQHQAKEGEIFFNVIKTSLVSYVGGAAPQIAVEAGRRAIPSSDRPSFAELEEAIKSWKSKTS